MDPHCENLCGSSLGAVSLFRSYLVSEIFGIGKKQIQKKSKQIEDNLWILSLGAVCQAATPAAGGKFPLISRDLLSL